MSKNFLSVSDGIRFKELATAPTSPIEGEVYYDTTLNVLRLYDGSAWVEVGSGGSSDAADVTVTPAGGITSTNVQDALEELDGDISSIQSGLVTLDTTKLNRNGSNSITGDLLPDSAGTRSLGSIANYFLNQSVRNATVNFIEFRNSGLTTGYGSITGNFLGSGPSGNSYDFAVSTSTINGLLLTSSNTSGPSSSGKIGIETGNSVNGNSGEISLRTGVPSGSGTRAKIVLDAASIDMSSKNVSKVAYPVKIDDAATKDYVDGKLLNFNYITNGNAESGTTGFSSLKEGPTLVSFDSSTDTITAIGHGLQNNTPVSFITVPAGEAGAVINTMYYVIEATASTFKVSTTVGGSALNLTASGSCSMAFGRPANSPSDTSGNLTITTTTTNPISGSSSFLITKDAVNRMGHKIVKPFTIDNGDKAKALTVSLEYMVQSGTFNAGTTTTEGDVRVFIRDVTNNLVIWPSNNKLLSNSTTLADKYSAQFQTSSNSTSYELILMVTSPNTSAWVLMVDDIKVSASEYVYGSPVTSSQAYTTTVLNGLGTPSAINLRYSRDGEYAIIEGRITAGTTSAVEGRVGLPPGLVSASDYTTLQIVGSAAATGVNLALVPLIEPNSQYIVFGYDNNATSALQKRNASDFVSTGGTFSFTARIRIQGWSSSVQMSDNADTRVVACNLVKNGNQSVTGDVTNISFVSTPILDTHGAFNGTDTYTIPVPGVYEFTYSGDSSSGTDLFVWVNGVKTSHLGNRLGTLGLGGTNQLNLKTGDLITLRAANSTTINGSGVSTALSYVKFSIKRLSGPSAIAATETIAASYWASANKSASTTQPIDFDSREFDSHGSVTTGSGWRFTSQSSRLYSINILAYVNTTAQNYFIYKNGVKYKQIAAHPSTTAGTGSVLIKLNVGDYIDIRTGASVTVIGGAQSANDVAKIEIVSLGI